MGTLAAWLLGLTLAGTAPPPVLIPESVTQDADAAAAWHLGRAVELWDDDLRGAVEHLRWIDTTAASPYPEADRAAFLLAAAYTVLGDRQGLTRVATDAGDPSGSNWRRWVAYLGQLEGLQSEPVSGVPTSRLLAAGRSVLDGDAETAVRLLADHPDAIPALHLRAAAGDAAARRKLLEQNSNDPARADLVASALLDEVAQVLTAGGDPASRLDDLSDRSRFFPRGEHLIALSALAAGDTVAGRRKLSDLLNRWPSYEARADVWLELSALAAARGDWPAALAAADDAAAEQDAARRRLDALETPAGAVAAWSVWDSIGHAAGELGLDRRPLRDELSRRVEAARDLRRQAVPDLPSDLPLLAGGGDTNMPTIEEWSRRRLRRSEYSTAAAESDEQSRHVGRLAAERESRRTYLDLGRRHGEAAIDTLTEAVARLDTLLLRLDAALAQLDATRDRALVRFARRGRDMGAELRRNRLYLEATRHFHSPVAAADHPADVPTVAEILVLEEDLIGRMEGFLALFAERSETLVRRSCETSWRPRLAGDGPRLHTGMTAQLTRAHDDMAHLDSTAAYLDRDPLWSAAVAKHGRLQAHRDSLAAVLVTEEQAVAAAVAERGRVRLDARREAVDLHRVDAAYRLAVATSTDDSRSDALDRQERFLTAHSSSPARSEIRFRQADLLLLEARREFESRMAGFLGRDPSADDLQNRDLAPFLDPSPALAQYAAILAEDPGYAHVDAVLFSLGMILADGGEATAAAHLRELVDTRPDSPYVQEAWLRLGDLAGGRGDVAGSLEPYAAAAAGVDPDLRGIALYKLGWARFERDEFAAAATAFAHLLDHGAESPDADVKTHDLGDEAREFLTRSLLRAGGASAWSDHVDSHGQRTWSAGVLHDMARLSRRFALLDEAVRCDELWLDRYPRDRRAVQVARRLVDTHGRAEQPAAALAALSDLAPRFLAGGDWNEVHAGTAQASSGQDFARDAYRTLATHHHRRARRQDDAAHWREARNNYETWLRHWPAAAGAPGMHNQAGETAARLGDHPAAVAHFTRAAAADTGSFRADAAWQVVAVTDDWYEAAGRPDSLAIRLLAAGDAYRAGQPDTTRLADLSWRQAHVSVAHELHRRAAMGFAAFAATHGADPRRVDALRLAGDAWYRLQDHPRAGDAYAAAAVAARTAGRDSLAGDMAAAVPVCRYQHAETVAADSTRGPRVAAPLFLAVARDWPSYDHADLALYRAGLGFDDGRSIAAWERLLTEHPASAYGRDAALEIARRHEGSGDRPSAATAYRRFSHVYRDDPEAADALLTAVGLAADDPVQRRVLEDDFMARFPGETDQAMVIRHERATAAVARLDRGAVLTDLLAGGSDLADYLDAARSRPDLADPTLLARVDYERAENAYTVYAALELTQPLPTSLAAKQAELENVVKLYNDCAARGVKEQAHAAAHRIGEAIVHFGDALAASERPADLTGDDLLAYEEVLQDQIWDFHARGEGAWTELLKQARSETIDPGAWLARTRAALWPRVALRFLHRPEVDYPLLAAAPPGEGP